MPVQRKGKSSLAGLQRARQVETAQSLLPEAGLHRTLHSINVPLAIHDSPVLLQKDDRMLEP